MELLTIKDILHILQEVKIYVFTVFSSMYLRRITMDCNSLQKQLNNFTMICNACQKERSLSCQASSIYISTKTYEL